MRIDFDIELMRPVYPGDQAARGANPYAADCTDRRDWLVASTDGTRP
jgi:hypothetical protein